jgi:hypothetical protein
MSAFVHCDYNYYQRWVKTSLIYQWIKIEKASWATLKKDPDDIIDQLHIDFPLKVSFKVASIPFLYQPAKKSQVRLQVYILLHLSECEAVKPCFKFHVEFKGMKSLIFFLALGFFNFFLTGRTLSCWHFAAKLCSFGLNKASSFWAAEGLR